MITFYGHGGCQFMETMTHLFLPSLYYVTVIEAGRLLTLRFVCSQVGEKFYVVFFLLAVFFVPLVVITASYLVVTVRIWRFSTAHRRHYGGAAAAVGRSRATSIRQTGCVKSGRQ